MPHPVTFNVSSECRCCIIARQRSSLVWVSCTNSSGTSSLEWKELRVYLWCWSQRWVKAEGKESLLATDSITIYEDLIWRNLREVFPIMDKLDTFPRWMRCWTLALWDLSLDDDGRWWWAEAVIWLHWRFSIWGGLLRVNQCWFGRWQHGVHQICVIRRLRGISFDRQSNKKGILLIHAPACEYHQSSSQSKSCESQSLCGSAISLTGCEGGASPRSHHLQVCRFENMLASLRIARSSALCRLRPVTAFFTCLPFIVLNSWPIGRPGTWVISK